MREQARDLREVADDLSGIRDLVGLGVLAANGLTAREERNPLAALMFLVSDRLVEIEEEIRIYERAEREARAA